MKNYDLNEKLKEIEKVIDEGPFSDTWESLSSYRVPEWYEKMRFGIFIHYGVFSVPAFGCEWYPRLMYEKEMVDCYEHHLKTYGKQSEFGYKDFIPMFKAENFDADRWIKTFKEAGAQYVIPVAEHHDGFQMYESELSSFNAVDMGPHKNILGELKEACKKENLIFGASSHRIEHFFFMGTGRSIESDINREFERGDLYWPSVYAKVDFDAVEGEGSLSEEFMQDWLVRTCEITDKYRPEILYFDWWIQRIELKPYLRKMLAYFYNKASKEGRGVVVNYKHDAIPFAIAVPDIERGQLASAKPFKWQSDTAMCFNSWCHTEGNRYKEAGDILCDLVDIISKNGTLLLNIGPKADGTFTEEETMILKQIGEWMKINREAVFDTKPYKIFGEGPTEVIEGGFMDGTVKGFTSSDFRFLAGKGCIYIIALRPSETCGYSVRSFAKKQGFFNSEITKITMLEGKDPIEFYHTSESLEIKTCKTSDNDFPKVFKLEIA
ncbi:MAG: alpha-L-fucosidase [Lachnospiraceae bacterium]|nr:alpha-L-fucosidase [Lachnospiraceae bacterium]